MLAMIVSCKSGGKSDKNQYRAVGRADIHYSHVGRIDSHSFAMSLIGPVGLRNCPDSFRAATAPEPRSSAKLKAISLAP